VPRLTDLRAELLDGQAVEVPHHPVVVQDLELVVREEDCHEELVRLVPARARVSRAHHLPVSHGGGRPVVSVGHVETGDVREPPHERLDLAGLGHDPERVPDPVGRDEVVGRRTGAHAVHDLLDLLPGAVGEEYRLGVRVGLGDVARPVVLLVPARVLVLLDEVPLVLAHAAQADDAGLDVAPHPLLIDVETGGRVAREDRVADQPVKVLTPPGVDAVVVEGNRRIEIDLRLADVQEGDWVSARQLARLLRGDHVVGEARDVARPLGARPVGPERLDHGHSCSFT
jgi:hypothetical protein